MAKITLNGVEHEVEDGQYLIRAARKLGVDIPHYCYHPGLPVSGNCRMCVVQIEGMPKLATACTTTVQDGMVVNTESKEVLEERSEVMEFLLRNHPIDCPICDQAGECGLQKYYMEHGLHDARVTVDEKVKKKKRVDLGATVILDSERCILCSRCVRFCKDVMGKEELVIHHRGCHAEIGTFPGKPMSEGYALNTTDICPVGALTSKEFRFKCRVWFMNSSASVCPGCERGCSTTISEFENEIQRLTPRENPAVNGFWMCDEGRLDFEWVNHNRLLVSEGPGGICSTADADAQVAAALGDPRKVAVIASPRCTNENLYALKSFAENVIPGATLAGGSYRAKGEDDGYLRLPDRNPNSKGMSEIGIAGDVANAIGGATTVIIAENDLAGDSQEMAGALAGKSVILLGPSNDATAKLATWRIPVTTYAEMDGSFTNFAGVTQTFGPAIRAAGESRPVHEVLRSVAGILGKDIGFGSYGDLRSALEAAVPSLRPAVPDEGDALADFPGRGWMKGYGLHVG